MSAEDCLKHPWLFRHPSSQVLHMDVAKDNLRWFVERWNDHPNSPYVFETACQIIAPCSARESELSKSFHSLHSLEGMSPSPCGSIVSSVGSDEAFLPINGSDEVAKIASADYIRRASDSTCVMKTTDVVERLNLADEIRKLTDRLFQLSSTPIELNASHETIARSSPIPIRGSPRNNLEVPWRKSKHRITNSSRDVPLSPKNGINPLCINFPPDVLVNTYKTRSFTTSTTTKRSENVQDTANGTKDMLLRLLEQWDGPPTIVHNNARHNSVSSDYNENENLGQKTISSLNLFFQSRTTNKRSHPFMKTNAFK